MKYLFLAGLFFSMSFFPSGLKAQHITIDVETVRQLAEQSHAEAQNNIGGMYLHGEGVPEDYEKAFRWIRLSAAQNYPPAQNNMGVIYLEGLGVPQDREQAIDWFTRSARQGFSIAQQNLRRVLNENGKDELFLFFGVNWVQPN